MNRTALLPLLACLTLLLALGACGGGGARGASPEADLAKPLEQVTTEAAQASVPELEATLAAYEPAVAAAQEQLDAALERSRRLEPGQLLGAVGDELTREVDRTRGDFNALENRRRIYERELAGRGE